MKITFFICSIFLFLGSSSYSQSYNSNTLNSLSQEEMQGGLDALSAMLGGASEVDIADEYSFLSSVNIQLTVIDQNNQESEMTMKMSFPKDDDYYGMEVLSYSKSGGEMPKAFIIFDYLNFKMISLMESSGQMMGIAMDLNAEQIEDYLEAEENEEIKNLEFTKSGKTKDILGYNCVQYIMKSTSGEGEYWVSDDKDIKISTALNAMSQSSTKNAYNMPKEYPDGAVLEMNYIDESGAGMNWLATEINKNDKQTIRTGDYTFINMGK